MIRIYCDAADAVLKETQTLTAGMINYPEVLLTFSDAWDGYGKAVIVKAGEVEESALIVNNKFVVPSECLAESGVNLIVGVSGSDGVHTIPTIWCSCGEILDGTDVNDSTAVGTATPSLVEQMLGYAEDVVEEAQYLKDYIIKTVAVDDTGANTYGTVDVSVTDTGEGENRTVTFTFTNLKGKGIKSVLFTASGENKGRVQVKLDDDSITNYDGIKDALAAIESLISDVETAETARDTAETARDTAEGGRESAEQSRSSAESSRETAEEARQNAEGLRDSNEGVRVANEAEREENENTRQSNESARVSAEEARAEEFAGWEQSGSVNGLKAEGFAVGQQNGVDVTDGSPYYHNNAKYYAQEAAGSEASAANYASDADGSATRAGASETNASGSASSASTNALKSEGFAVGEQGGSAVGSTSPYYHNNAKYYSDLAAGYADSADDWLQENISQETGYVLDRTLLLQNAAAPADKVGELKTALGFKSLNVYDGNTSNGYVRPNDGEFISGTTTKATDYLPVTGGKYVVSSYNGAKREMYLIAVFDNTKTVIPEAAQRTGDGNQRSSGYFLLPASAAYIRVTYLNANVNANNKLYILDSVDYNPTITIQKSLVLDNGDLLPFAEIAKAQDIVGTESANVYDEVTTNGYVNPTDGTFTSGSTTKVTNYLEVIPNMYAVSSYNGAKNEMYLIALFDKDKNVIPELISQSGDGKQRATGYFLLPENCKYIRATYVNANIHVGNKIYLLSSVDYEPSNVEIKTLFTDDGEDLPIVDIIDTEKLVEHTEASFKKSHKYYRQKVVAMGDSVTNGQTWFDGAEVFFGYRPVNKGVAGSTVSTVGSNGFCTDARVNDIPTDTKVLLLMGGINDWLSNVPLGDKDVTNVDTTTFYGAVNVLVQKLNTRIPNATIICMGNTFGIYPNYTGFTDTEGVFNNLDLCTLDYGKAFVDMCNLNGIKSFVIGYECGWNLNNISTYVADDGAYLHPNSVGGARMASVIADNIP